MNWLQSLASSLTGSGGIGLPAMILGLLLPACGARGPSGLPAATPIDLATLQRPTSPNTALAGPASLGTHPDLAVRRYDVPGSVLLAALHRIAATEPRVYPLGRFDDRLQAAYVARSRVLNFPDIVQVAAVPDGGGSWPVIYSRSVYGRYDFGVNRRRVEAWLARIPDAIRAETE
jgi:uncharacterized protein (DUF1499 family)